MFKMTYMKSSWRSKLGVQRGVNIRCMGSRCPPAASAEACVSSVLVWLPGGGRARDACGDVIVFTAHSGLILSLIIILLITVPDDIPCLL